MGFPTIMVQLDYASLNDAKLEITGQLAELFDAMVIGVAAAEPGQSAYFMAGPYAEKLIEETRERVLQSLAEMEKNFRTAMKGRAKDVEWRSALDLPVWHCAKHSRCADLIVVNSPDAGTRDPLSTLDPAELIMRAGRPVLIVPPDRKWLDLRHGMVAWKDTREARRAIHDALPLLKKAKDVTIVEVFDEEGDKAAIQASLKDVKAWLARHGVSATEFVSLAEADATDRLDVLASDLGATFIVAGAYGHARFQEWAFGGMTRHLLTQKQHCVLMSH